MTGGSRAVACAVAFPPAAVAGVHAAVRAGRAAYGRRVNDAAVRPPVRLQKSAVVRSSSRATESWAYAFSYASRIRSICGSRIRASDAG